MIRLRRIERVLAFLDGREQQGGVVIAAFLREKTGADQFTIEHQFVRHRLRQPRHRRIGEFDVAGRERAIGFGKTHEHNLALLANCWRFHELDCPVLVGHSRKGFIGKVIGDKDADRLAGTIGVALSLAKQGVQIIRVHDIAPLRQALLLFAATDGVDDEALRQD